MSSVPAGKRNWKCPECGRELQLSIAQLDPIACDECVAKMRGGGKSSSTPSVADAVAGPIGIWSGLPETTKLGVVAVALVVGLLVGFIAGKSSAIKPTTTHRGTTHTAETASNNSTGSDDDSVSEDDTESRPESPGPGYKWVRRYKRKDGSYVEGHWAKESHHEKKK